MQAAALHLSTLISVPYRYELCHSLVLTNCLCRFLQNKESLSLLASLCGVHIKAFVKAFFHPSLARATVNLENLVALMIGGLENKNFLAET